MRYLKKYKLYEEQLRVFREVPTEEPLTEGVKDSLSNLLYQSTEAQEIDLVKFFVERGADVNTEGVCSEAIFERDIFEYLYSKGMTLDGLVGHDNYGSVRNRLREAETQAMFIDLELENWLVDQKIPFNDDLRNYGVKYSTVIDRFEQSAKFGI